MAAHSGRRAWAAGAAVSMAAVMAAAPLAAQQFSIERSVVTAGGGSSADAGGVVRIRGTFAEPLTGGAALSSVGGAFVITGGFWADSLRPRDRLFIDQFEPAAPPVPDRQSPGARP